MFDSLKIRVTGTRGRVIKVRIKESDFYFVENLMDSLLSSRIKITIDGKSILNL